MSEYQGLPEGVDPTTPSIARIYDAALGGKNNFAADREVVEQIKSIGPFGVRPALENRAFLRRAVRFLAGLGIRQFLDLGSGLPTQGNVHEVAQEVRPDARVVYVDYDPQAVAHSRALLAGTEQAIAIQADVRQPEAILNNPEVRRLLDFDQPMAVLFCAILHAIPDSDDPEGIVRAFREAMAPGSYLVISHLATREDVEHIVGQVRELFERQVREPFWPRTRARILSFFEGLELVDPGLVTAPEWRPDPPSPDAADEEPPTDAVVVAVGRKP